MAKISRVRLLATNKGYCCEIGFLEANKKKTDSRQRLADKLEVCDRTMGYLLSANKKGAIQCPLVDKCCKK